MMSRSVPELLTLLLAGVFLTITTPALAAGSSPADVTQARALAADSEPGNWLLHGRTFSEQFFSPLRNINSRNVRRLGVAWYADVGSPAGLVGQPLMVDGVVYFTGLYSIVTALDAGSGKQLWTFVPPNIKLTPKAGANPLSVWNLGTNRGLALWEGRVYISTGDCRLIAIDATAGREDWEVQTCDTTKGYAISGAPRVAAGKVFIGNSGSDNGARGYVTAYDSKTGKQLWRFYTIPAKVDGKFENELMALAARTWDEGAWENGGGVVWDSMTYDPEFNRLYIGTSCGGPLDARKRNPSGGDQLFMCAIVALNADTGRYVWHYSANPNFWWDYDAVMTMTLADLTIDGQVRKVLMQAPKNGFFFVLDRETGRFLSAKNYTKVTWAKGYDQSGRPMLAEEGKYWEQKDGAATVYPSDQGSHSFQPMSFSPMTGLAYIPTCEFGSIFRASGAGAFGGVEVNIFPFEARDPDVPKVLGRLVAWDPITQSLKWEFSYSSPCNGGVLSTAGDLVFQGDNYGNARAFAAGDGNLLWSTTLSSAIQSAPITYLYRGEQYVLFLTGLGGGSRSIFANYASRGPSRVVALKLGGKLRIPEFHEPAMPRPAVADTASAESVANGEHTYGSMWCITCHGERLQVPSVSMYPDLRRMSKETFDNWLGIVLGGSRSEHGMLSFADVLDEKQALAIRDYVVHRAWTDYNAQQQAVPGR